MLQKSDFPILEFDDDKSAMIRPENFNKPADTSAERCVLCFFDKAIEKILAEFPHKIIAWFGYEGVKLPVYEIEYKGSHIALVQASVGAPLAAGQVEEMCGYGFRKLIVCGSCGVLQKDIQAGHVIIPTSAVRDEGTSYHYAAPSREIEADPRAVEAIEKTLKSGNIPYIKAKTWTTDALYRETTAKIQRRREEGCVAVEMEASAYMAAARFNGAVLGQILYAGDNLDAEEWDARGLFDRADVRESLLRVVMDACLSL
ncbi:MAG: nucleoside phosphorylase [Defluviitaleaceae bacterium]|nr:nucleoside phosphorylase [Defluviitaleaceae bacterium]